MSAPTLNGDWMGELLALRPGWDSYNAPPITPAAIETVGRIHVVPCCDGGIQIEAHRDGWDIEIVVGPDGRIESGCMEFHAPNGGSK